MIVVALPLLTLALALTVITVRRVRASARTLAHVLDAAGWVCLSIAAWLTAYAAVAAGGRL